ncbi:hypothetical protein VKT23_017790 [Stygiomarasmius scandens]|uniref:Uncharacterized protein n=1 Tax=Marasmiellus scandens TaxID=2682957 RepID=A0ABR1ITU7_9AGAR
MNNGTVTSDERGSTITPPFPSTLCYNGIRVVPCARPAINPLPKKPHFGQLRINHNASNISSVPHIPSQTSTPGISQPNSTTTSPQLPPANVSTNFQTPQRQSCITSTGSPPNAITCPPLTVPGAPQPARCRRAMVQYPHPYAHAYQHHKRARLAPSSPVPTFEPTQSSHLSSLHSLLDQAYFRILRDISQFQSSCYAVLHNERRQKELFKEQMLAVKQERDCAVQQLRVTELENQRLAATPKDRSRQNLKRHRSDTDIEACSALPTPGSSTDKPASPCARSQCEEDHELEDLMLSYPTFESDSYFPQGTRPLSPPPPPISGRRLFFTTSSRSSSPPSCHDLCSPIHLEPDAGPRNAHSLADVISHDPNNHEEYLRRRQSKRRRIESPGQSDKSESGETLVDHHERRTSSPASPRVQQVHPVSSGRTGTPSGSDNLGECDMDLESDSDIESVDVPLAVTFKSSTTHDNGKFPDSRRVHSPTTSSRSSLRSKTSASISSTPPSSAPNLTPIRQKSIENFPKLNLKDLGKMFIQEEDRIYCRLCPRPGSQIRIESETHESATSFAPLDAARPNLDTMVMHCTHEHPKAYSDVSGLSLEQVYVLKAVINEKSRSPKVFSPLNS